SSVFRTRFSRSGGSVRVWPSIATTGGEARTPVVPCAAPTRRRSRRPALPSQLAHGGPVGDQDGVRGPEEEPRVHDTGNRADRALEPGRVRDRFDRAVQDDVSVVGHEGVLGGHPERGTGAERGEAAPAQRQRERDDLDGQPTPAAEPHGGVVLDEPEGPASERTERFRWVEVHAFRPHNTIGSLLPAYPLGLLPRTAGIPPVLALIARARRMRAWTLSLRCCSSPR